MGIPTEEGWDCNLATVFNTCWCAHPSTLWHPPTSNTYGGTKQSGGEKEEKRILFRRPEHRGSYYKSVVHVTALRSKDTKLPNAIVANFASPSLPPCITYQSYRQHPFLEMCALLHQSSIFYHRCRCRGGHAEPTYHQGQGGNPPAPNSTSECRALKSTMVPCFLR